MLKNVKMKNVVNHIITSSTINHEWQDIVASALEVMNEDYLEKMLSQWDWIPAIDRLLSAFSLPLSSVNYILLGESPYPREASANGYAFWDASIGCLWSEKGLSRAVNRATSLRNMIKSMLVARGDLEDDVSQPAITNIDKSDLVQTADDFFQNLLAHGFLLLNAALIYSKGEVNYHARHWQPFISSIFCQLAGRQLSIKLVLLGKIADNIPKTTLPVALAAEHPFNLSFIRNPAVLSFFKPLDLLANYE